MKKNPEFKELPIRLALRVEGNKWNAYIASSDTMEDSIWVGSIDMSFIAEDTPRSKKRKQAFMKLMTDAVSEYIENILHKKPVMKVRDAPEYERSKE
jgi:hypothetical protein